MEKETERVQKLPLHVSENQLRSFLQLLWLRWYRATAESQNCPHGPRNAATIASPISQVDRAAVVLPSARKSAVAAPDLSTCSTAASMAHASASSWKEYLVSNESIASYGAWGPSSYFTMWTRTVEMLSDNLSSMLCDEVFMRRCWT